jgi:predicted nucleotidyltransferase
MAHAAQLVEVAAGLGATHVCLCGSVARGTDSDDSDIDFYVRQFDEGATGAIERIEARRRADDLVRAFRALSPYRVDVRGIPGWLLDPPHESTMQRDSIELSRLVE